jgi:hypothetical protein
VRGKEGAPARCQWEWEVLRLGVAVCVALAERLGESLGERESLKREHQMLEMNACTAG